MELTEQREAREELPCDLPDDVVVQPELPESGGALERPPLNLGDVVVVEGEGAEGDVEAEVGDPHLREKVLAEVKPGEPLERLEGVVDDTGDDVALQVDGLEAGRVAEPLLGNGEQQVVVESGVVTNSIEMF